MSESLEQKISSRISAADKKRLKSYCRKNKIKESTLIRVAVMERISEDKVIFQPPFLNHIPSNDK